MIARVIGCGAVMAMMGGGGAIMEVGKHISNKNVVYHKSEKKWHPKNRALLNQ